MLRSILLFAMMITLVALTGCEEKCEDTIWDPRPEPPQGVYSVTGDEEVVIVWLGSYDGDIKEYIVYRNEISLDDDYVEIGRRTAKNDANLVLDTLSYTDDNLNNATTYYYAVASVDNAGQISTLSAENVYDTPRPEGILFLNDIAVQQSSAGIHFVSGGTIDASSSECDAYVDSDDFGIYYLNAGDLNSSRGTKIQGMGYTYDWDDIGYAPTTSWSNLGYVEIVVNHTYIIKTDDNHYAKMRVLLTDGVGVSFEWAYQADVNNPELVAPAKDNEPNVTYIYSKKKESQKDSK